MLRASRAYVEDLGTDCGALARSAYTDTMLRQNRTDPTAVFSRDPVIVISPVEDHRDVLASSANRSATISRHFRPDNAAMPFAVAMTSSASSCMQGGGMRLMSTPKRASGSARWRRFFNRTGNNGRASIKPGLTRHPQGRHNTSGSSVDALSGSQHAEAALCNRAAVGVSLDMLTQAVEYRILKGERVRLPVQVPTKALPRHQFKHHEDA